MISQVRRIEVENYLTRRRVTTNWKDQRKKKVCAFLALNNRGAGLGEQYVVTVISLEVNRLHGNHHQITG